MIAFLERGSDWQQPSRTLWLLLALELVSIDVVYRHVFGLLARYVP
jgi:hypothetical protein